MRALRWIAHPVTVVATAVLYLNDHVFKPAWPGPVTGKLSDVAGMVMFPALLGALAGLVGVPLRVSRWAAPLVAAAGFAWVKATAVGAAAASAAWSGVVLRDPSDLVALPAVALAWWTAGRVEQAPAVADVVARRVRLFAALGFALVATAATTPPPDPPAVAYSEETAGGGVVVTLSDGTKVYSPDGVSAWRVTERGDLYEPDMSPDQKSAGCAPDEPAHCYRLFETDEWTTGKVGKIPAGGRLIGVEETLDHGVTWTTAWEIPAERWEFLALGHHLSIDWNAASLVSVDVLVRAVPGGHQVIVANGVDGLAVRDPDGTWHRVAIEAGPGAYFVPQPLTRFGRGVGEPGNVGIALALLTGLVSGIVLSVRAGIRRGLSVVLYWPLLLIPVLLFGAGLGTFSEGGFTVLLAPTLLVGGFFTACFQRLLPRGRALAYFGALTLAALAYTVPFLGWSVGVPGSKGDARLYGLIAFGVAAALSLAVAWWASARPLPRRTLAQLYHPQRWTPPAAPGPRRPRGPGQW